MRDTPKTATSRTSGEPHKRLGIFISYRRADSMNATGRLYERLRKRYGTQHVFKDLNSLQTGDDFTQAVRQSLAQSAVALIMIGRTWADARDQEGKRRLDEPSDFVRREVEEAFEQGVTVVPVVVEGGRIPDAEELPESMRRLPTLNAVVVNNDPDFEVGARRLVKHLDPLLSPGMRPAVKVRRAVLSVLVVLALLAVLLPVLAPLAFPASESCGSPSTAVAGLSAIVSVPNGRNDRARRADYDQDRLNAVVSVPNGNAVDAWAIGSDATGCGYILHEHGRPWTKVSPLGLAARTAPPTLFGLAVAASGEGWAVGRGGTILHLSGGVWKAVHSPTTLSLYSVALSASGSEGWAVGGDVTGDALDPVGSGTILHLSGGVWNAVPSPTPGQQLASVALSASGSEGWALDGGGTILHLTGGVWSAAPSHTGQHLFGVALSTSGGEGWAVGQYGTILHLMGGVWSAVNGSG